MKKMAIKFGVLLASLMVATSTLGGSAALAKAHQSSTAHHATTSHKKAVRARASSPDAKKLFAAKKLPAALPPESIGGYSNGCLAGGVALPMNGPHWQVMRPLRNRNWGHPGLIDFVKRLSEKAYKDKDSWSGVLVGDMSQPRGGPMISGHASHNIGRDVDLWLTPMPDHILTEEERNTMSAHSVLKLDSADFDANYWTDAHAAFVRNAAEDPEVVRIFVTPAIKKFWCDKRPQNATFPWLSKLRPCPAAQCVGHDDHIHIRLKCAPGDKSCIGQPAPDASDDGCGSELTGALRDTANDPPYSSKPDQPSPYEEHPLSKLPKACMRVLNAKP
jgi:penicillin-insensitive murein endopeptidase